MKCPRLGSLIAVPVCVLAFSLFSATGAAQQPPQQSPQTPPKQQPQSPFESVPTGTEEKQPEPAKPEPAKQEPAKPPESAKPEPSKQAPFEQVPVGQEETAAPKPEAAKTPEAATTTPGQIPNIIDGIEFRGSRRVPQDTLRALIFTKKGDVYNDDALHRDFMALWNTGRFDDIRMEKEPGPNGWVVRYVVTERQVVRSIKYEGMKSVTVSEILDRFKERKVGLTVESQYDPNKVQRAALVLKEYLAERGRQFATVDPEIRQIPPSTVEVTFVVKEGPKVKVGDIDFVNNTVFSARELKRSMRNLKPIGIPYSIYFEDLFAKSYDASKLEQDEDMIRNFYQEHGYFTARVVDTKVTVVDTGGTGMTIPLIKPNKPGKKADLTLTIEEGKLYHLNNINFVGVKLFRTPETLMRPLFQMDKGDIFSTAKLRKGMENMRKLYGEFGYIDFVPEPEPEVNTANGTVDLTFNIDEGKQFFVRRIDFSGNTTTRDKVIRRELLIDEGDMFNSRLWEVSILRLNQLGYFEALKAEEAAVISRDPKTNTVDINLKVKERGKNSIQLNGGVSGIAGSFIGFSYSTNNFLGLGETLTLEGQLGTRIRNATFGFTEPYLFDKPIQAGFTLYLTRFNYDQGRETSIISGQNLIPLFQSLGTNNLLNYVSTGYGFTTFMSYPLKRSFARVGMSYGFDVSNIDPLTPSATTYFEYLNFQGLGGPNQLQGIKTSRIIPSYTYNTVNHPITPTQGKSLFVSGTFAGSFLGGNVNLIEPNVDAKYFRAGFMKGHVIGMHFLGRFITGYDGKVAPPFNRFYMGGEQDIRGFQVWGISPVAFIPSSTSVGVYNQDGSQRMQKIIANGQEQYVQATQQVPFYQMIWPGGDTQGVTNFEYRIPIFGPVILAAFYDVGVDKITRPNQLTLNPTQLVNLNSTFPSAGFSGQAVVAPHTQAIRSSTGLELQVLMPVVNAPFRFYWAYNPQRLETTLYPPVAADPSMFPNQATYVRALAVIGQPIPWYEKASTFRFSIGRTF